MLDASMAFNQGAFVGYLQQGLIGDRFTRVATSQSYIFRCADDKLLAVHLSTGSVFWTSLAVDVLESPELAQDARFCSHPQRVRHYSELKDLLAARFLGRARQEWMARLEQADVPFAPVYRVDEALADPHVAASDMICELQHPTQGTVRTIQSPILVDGERPHNARRAPPTPGEHSEEVRRLARG